MRALRSRADVARALAGRAHVTLHCAAEACDVNRTRMLTMLRGAGVAAVSAMGARFAVADVLAAVEWAWDHETVNAAAKRHGVPAKTMERILVARGLIVTWHTSGGAGWHAVARRDVDDAVRAHRAAVPA